MRVACRCNNGDVGATGRYGHVQFFDSVIHVLRQWDAEADIHHRRCCDSSRCGGQPFEGLEETPLCKHAAVPGGAHRMKVDVTCDAEIFSSDYPRHRRTVAIAV